MIISGVNRSLDLNRFLFIIIYKEEKNMTEASLSKKILTLEMELKVLELQLKEFELELGSNLNILHEG